MIGRRKREPEPVPAALPQVTAEVVSEQHVVLTVDGQPIPAAPTSRSEFGRATGELVARLDSPTRVQVRELDGRVWADLITPSTPTTPLALSLLRPVLLEFTADGFISSEHVAIALVLRYVCAASDGTARALLDRAEKARVAGEVILFGRISGTTSIQRVD